ASTSFSWSPDSDAVTFARSMKPGAVLTTERLNGTTLGPSPALPAQRVGAAGRTAAGTEVVLTSSGARRQEVWWRSAGAAELRHTAVPDSLPLTLDDPPCVEESGGRLVFVTSNRVRI